MKRLAKIYIVILISFISCSTDIKDSDFVGKWSIIEYNTDNTKGLSKELIKGAKDIAMNSTYLINEDNTFSSMIGGSSNQGTWEFDKDSKTLSLNGFSNKPGSSEKFIVDKISKSKIYTSQKIPGFGYIKITLGKIKDK